jgi:gamma-glutamylcysteine synthetase
VNAAGAGLVSTELECPVVSLADGRPAPPALFAALWEDLASDSWRRAEIGLVREHRVDPALRCISADQHITTDTGPTMELVPAPGRSLAEVAAQLEELIRTARAALNARGYALLGSAVHPRLHATPEDYYRFRSPRRSYDYVIRERGWHHWSIVNIASVQEIVDVAFDDAPRAIRVLHRLAGLMNFLLRNDPDLLGDYDGQISVRPRAWREHIPASARFAGDAAKVGLPAREVTSWADYLALLWDSGPLFLVGTKDAGTAYLPQHPSFFSYLQDVPADGWPAKTILGESLRVFPEIAHVIQTDWTYMGFARIRWKWREAADGVPDFLKAWHSGQVEAFLRANIEKVVIENRSTSAQPPGDTLVSLALVAGLLANLDEAQAFALSEPHPFWLSLLAASTTEPLRAEVAGHSIPVLARRMLDVASRGLALRGEGAPEAALAPLYRRIESGRSPAESALCEYQTGGVLALLRTARL